MRGNLADFANRLKILRSIDLAEMDTALMISEGVDPLDFWRLWRVDPSRALVEASDQIQAMIWAIVDRQSPPEPPPIRAGERLKVKAEMPGHWHKMPDGDIFELIVRNASQGREDLCKGNLTDFQAANAIFMTDRNDLELTAYQTMAKERIRWLSVQLALRITNAIPEEEIAALRRDAARYRWLRDDNGYVPEEQMVRGGAELDELCDEWMKRQAEAKAAAGGAK